MPSGATRKLPPSSLAATAGLLASCSLLAPSDEEAMRGLTSPTPTEAGTEASATDARVDAGTDVVDAGPTGPTPECSTCPRACNGGSKTCAACLLNGGKCRVDGECCTGGCNGGTCGPAAGACVADNEQCSSSPDSCCAPATCSQERGGRCATCSPNGENCKGDTDCCSVHCGGGRCAACLAKGATGCTSNRQCCSNVCAQATGTCQ